MGMTGCKPLPTPMAVTPPLRKNASTPLSPEQATKYRQCCGSLQYITFTRPDLSFAVSKLTQYMHTPTELHLQALKRMLRYLKGTATSSLLLSKTNNFNLEAYVDADWAGSLDDRKLTGGYLIYLGCNLIGWSSKKQSTVARSSIESEFKAVANTSVELQWLSKLIQELCLPAFHPPKIWCDNLGAVFISSNAAFRARTRHVEVDFHFVREQVSSNQLKVHSISSNNQLADILTKPLPTQSFHLIRSKLRLLHRPSA